MSELEIWGRASSTNVQKVLWLFAEIGTTYRRYDVGGRFGGLDNPDYLALNPNGLIPTIRKGDFVLWESHAILRYVSARNPDYGFTPLDVQARAIMDQWLDWQMVALGLPLRDLFWLTQRPGATPPTPQAVAQAAALVEQRMALLEKRLSRSRFIAGDAFGLADIACGVSVRRWHAIAEDRPALPALEAWYAQIEARPAFSVVNSASLK